MGNFRKLYREKWREDLSPFGGGGIEQAGSGPELPASLADYLRSLPGSPKLWKYDDLSGTSVIEAGGNATFNGTYAGAIPLASVALPADVGGSVANFQDSNDSIALFTTALQNFWSWQEGWCSILMKQSPPYNKQFIFLDAGYSPTVTMAAHTSAGVNGYVRMDAGGAKVGAYYQRHDDWALLSATWSVSGNKYNVYYNGALIYTNTYTTAQTTLQNNIFMGNGGGFRGALGYWTVGSGAIPEPSQFDQVYKKIYPSTYKSLLVIGDSWATDNDYWIDQLVADLRTSTGDKWREAPYRIGYSGQSVAYINTNLATDLPARLYTQPDMIVLVAAANDITGGTAEAAFKSDFGGILDTLQTNCQGVPVVINFPYRDDAYDGSYDAAALAIKGWMQTVIATKSGTYYTIDGNTWFKTNIDTWSGDRIHPTTELGYAELVGEIMTAAGY